MVNKNILEEVSAYSKQILSQLGKSHLFHSLQHTCEVVDAAKIIADECNLSDQDKEKVYIACWFHDVGFSVSPYNHEDHSAKLAREFLSGKGYPEKDMELILGCIVATQLPQKPQNLLEEVVCDADMYYLSTKDYWSKNQLLRLETELITSSKIRNDQWCYENLNFLSQHRYHTKYGKRVLTKRKQRHLNRNVQKLEALKTL